MAAFEHLLSQAHRHCFKTTSSTLSNYLRSHHIPLFHRSLCSSTPSSSPQQNPDSISESQSGDYSRRPPVIELKPVSYPVKTITESPPEKIPSRSSSPSSLPPPQARTWTREDARYVKDTPSFSPVSYPNRVAPLPEYTETADAPSEDAGNEEVQPENEQLDRETRIMEADKQLFRRAPRVEDEEIPFPTLIKATNTKKDKTVYDLKEALQLIQTNAKRNFDETLEAHVKLTPDLRRTDLKLTGSALLPHGTGKAVRVAVFAEGPAADEAKTAGADVVGGEELIEGIKNGTVKVDFDKCIATPQIMSRVSKTISKTLRRLTPNAKEGTVTNDISRVVREAKQNIMFRKDKSAIVHVGLGKVSFGEEALRENIGAFVHALLLAKPAGLKKSSKYAGYVSTFHLCSTMGPSYPVTIQSLSIAAERFNKMQVR